MKRLLRKYPLTLLCVVTIWVLCLVTPPSTGLPTFSGFDKVCHIVMYLGSCSVLWWERLRSGGSTGWSFVAGALLLPILMSGLIEIVQETATTTRGADWYDVLANAVGTVLAILFGHFALRPLVRRSGR